MVANDIVYILLFLLMDRYQPFMTSLITSPHAFVSVSGVFVVSRSDRFQERTHKQYEAPAGALLNLCASETPRLISSEPRHQSARGKLFRRRVTDR